MAQVVDARKEITISTRYHHWVQHFADVFEFRSASEIELSFCNALEEALSLPIPVVLVCLGCRITPFYFIDFSY